MQMNQVEKYGEEKKREWEDNERDMKEVEEAFTGKAWMEGYEGGKKATGETEMKKGRK